MGALERREGERSEPERSGEGPNTDAGTVDRPGSEGNVPDPEVSEKAVRRRFPASYKLRILREVAACRRPGDIGALLRREGLYSSQLSSWRKQQAEGVLRALSPRKRGRKRKEVNPLAKRVAEVERENRRLRRKLEQADLIITIQKKVAALLGIELKSPESGESD